ncbi:MAG: molybdenum cofactor guanylyltransferase [Fimbriiglobus sp.]
MSHSHHVGAIVLAGGQSRRMGTSKAWLEIDGTPMLRRVVDRVQPVAGRVVVISAAGAELPEMPDGVVIIHDEEPELGPLMGLAVGFEALSTELVVVLSCDVPNLPSEAIVRLVEGLGDADAILGEAEGRSHPLIGVYRRSVATIVRDQLAKRELALHRLLARLQTKTVSLPADWLQNLNTPDDLAEFLAAK